MPRDKIYVGHVGLPIICDCDQDVSAATVRKINVERPDGSVVVWDAVAHDSTHIKFVTIAGSLNASGKWRFQPEVTTPSFGPALGKSATLTVYPAFG